MADLLCITKYLGAGAFVNGIEHGCAPCGYGAHPGGHSAGDGNEGSAGALRDYARGMQELLYGSVSRQANDAAIAIGGEEGFVPGGRYS